MTASPGRPTARHRQPADFAALAREAGAEVNARFGHRLMGLPGTWIGALDARPLHSDTATRQLGKHRKFQAPWSEWHYWWQAHYLDAVLDAGFLALARGDRSEARAELQRARALLRGILIRNFGVFRNDYYDDMVWLALAAGRLNELSLRLTARTVRLAKHAVISLTHQLHGGHDDVLGGGIYWSRKRDFKNTPVNGPAALLFARIGEVDRAASLLDWLRVELFEPKLGLYLDGVHPTPNGRSVENTIYTYNQGPVLAAMLEVGRPQDLAHAEALIESVRSRLVTPGQSLRLEPGGDGSLFTGILCRYLAFAAHDSRLPATARHTASALVRDAAVHVAGQSPDQLSTAVQRWTILSATAALDD
ncbi:glycoside hydrolase family 76 protein [Arthrobacter sp. H35-D1]|uniref:glycoside hydrolase family 76 protein n=1 Tax=Arthrobacter sp. H35-D1 TaxID=3046202 RepID=UPI0024BB5891|nr:glycoside hydrolase family 76 protein [Arthrobacter sp. H35-D1]MDJ0311709.1 glycoside hydrolase family 76 protein [Arthrobacter sp. H35-D1]